VNHLRNTATKKLILLGYCPTQDMVADLLTKALGCVKLHNLKVPQHAGAHNQLRGMLERGSGATKRSWNRVS